MTRLTAEVGMSLAPGTTVATALAAAASPFGYSTLVSLAGLGVESTMSMWKPSRLSALALREARRVMSVPLRTSAVTVSGEAGTILLRLGLRPRMPSMKLGMAA